MQEVEGHVDCLTKYSVSGWFWHPCAPQQRIKVQVIHKGKVVSEILAAEYRPDLAAAGKGNGFCSFRARFDPPLDGEAPPHLRLDSDHSQILHHDGWVEHQRLEGSEGHDATSVEGVIERYGTDGVQGWAWCPYAPNERVLIEAVIGNRVLAAGVADKFRKDLLDAEKGDGAHGFKLDFVPWLQQSDEVPKIRAAHLSLGANYDDLRWFDIRCDFKSLVPPDDSAELHVDRLDHKGAAGWAWLPSRPESSLRIEAVHKGKVIAATWANTPRADLHLAGKGSGRYGFDLSFAGTALGRTLPTIRAAQSVDILEVNSAASQDVEAVEGYVDFVDRQLARGWVWRPSRPNESVSVEARQNGRVVGRALADVMRDDLARGGKGTGRYGFTIYFYDHLQDATAPDFYAVSSAEECFAGNMPLPDIADSQHAQDSGTALQRLLDEHRQFTQAGKQFEELDTEVLRRLDTSRLSEPPLVLAFYLPQFHAIPENDRNWGKGFTEWRQLTRALPRFPGHYQPRIPRDLGFYDLNDPMILPRQAAMATAMGIGAFCYYYYWFNGRRVLDLPLDTHMGSELTMPFAIMWANESWSKTWDGSEDEVLLQQDYHAEHEDALIADLARHFSDRRYLKVSGRPLFFIYNPVHIPDTAETVTRWRRKLLNDHDMNPMFFMAQTFEVSDPEIFGFDGAIEFPPHKLAGLSRGSATPTPYASGFRGRIIAYDDFVEASLAEEDKDYPIIKTVVPHWDNDARRPGRGLSLAGSSPAKYQRWLKALIDRAIENPIAGMPIVAVNAWNEWAEAAYLEPDVHYGSAYLNATARAIVEAVNNYEPGEDGGGTMAITAILPCYNHARYLRQRIESVLNQTVLPAEIVFLDDASTDNSVEIAREMLGNSKIPWRIEVNDLNSGSVFAQWLKGISLASHQLIWIAETDDVADRAFLANIVSAFRRSDVLGAYGHTRCIDDNGVVRHDLDNYYQDLLFHSWDSSSIIAAHKSFSHDFSVQNIIPNVSAFVFRKPILSSAEMERLLEYKVAGDWYFYSLVLRGGSIAYRRKARSFFRITQQSVSRKTLLTDRHLAEHKMILQDLSQEYGVNPTALEAHAVRLSRYFPNISGSTLKTVLKPEPSARQLRLCIGAHSFGVGGAEVLPALLANELRGKGCHVTYLVMERVPDGQASICQRLRPDIPVVYWEDVSDCFEEFLRDYGIDVFNSHNVGIDYALSQLNVQLPCTFVASLHGGYETVPNLITAEFLRYLERQVDGWLYLAERNRDTLVGAGLRSGQFEESFNAVDADQIIWENRDQFRKQHGLSDDAFALVICSRAIRSKGWETAVLVAKILNARQSTPVHLFLIGEGPDLDDLKREHGDAPRVHFLGHVDQPARLLRCFDLSLFPSTYAGESFPLFLLESMAAGLPIVSTDNGNISRLIGSDGVRAGALVRSSLSGEAMAEEMASLVGRYMVDNGLYERSRDNALRNSERYSLSNLAAHYLAFFRERMLGQARTRLNDMTG